MKRLVNVVRNPSPFEHSYQHHRSASLANVVALVANSASPELGFQAHAQIIKLGLSNDTFSSNHLIRMYCKNGFFADGLKVFDKMSEKHRNIVSWTLIISGSVQNDGFDIGIKTFLSMMRTGLMPNEFTIGSVFKLCCVTGLQDFALCIHSFAFKSGFERNPFVGTSILHSYAMSGDVEAAELVFKCMDSVDVCCWNAMIGGYAHCGYGFEAIKILSWMCHRGLPMDKFTFVNAVKACSVMGNMELAKQLHGRIMRSNVMFCTSVVNALMDMYFSSGEMDFALKLFHVMQSKDIVSWNIVFGGLLRYEDSSIVAGLVTEFFLTGSKPNQITFSTLFRLCAERVDLKFGLQLHALIFHLGFSNEASVSCSVVSMFSRCGVPESARLVFDWVVYKDTDTWNEMISGYSYNHLNVEAVKFFKTLWESEVEANNFSFSYALEASYHMEDLRISGQIHSCIVKSGFICYETVYNSLIKAFVKLGLAADCFKSIDGLEKLDLTSWSAIISTFVRHGSNHEAIELLKILFKAGEKPDEFVIGSALHGCANMAAYNLSKSVHSFVIKMGFETNVFVASAVIDAYAKCGDIKGSRTAFDQTSIFGDVVLFNTMIMAYAQHGLVMEAISIFKQLKLADLQPSQATFVSLISACSHFGLVDEGRRIFDSINSEYGMEPSPNNYGCFVDLLSRHGFLDDAKCVIEVMPFPPWPAIFRSLLSGCRIHGNIELGEWAAKNLLQLVPDNDAAHCLLSKVYSEIGSWENAAKVRHKMLESGVQKDLGCSWIQL
ncbi:Pentatricopeptide repeat [Dillenia turbinata]|uniref:Pentatricopeptide repeat n=1 Tax=Dillenia turbinata TaxID=194707 RepID=A0AAN8VE02_9MAGN